MSGHSHPSLPATLGPGFAEPMGAHVCGNGVNFSVFSEHAARIELCLFDAGGKRETGRYTLHGPVGGVFHGFLEGATAGLIYGFRAEGPYAPREGHRFNANKLLLDPHAREIVGRFEWRGEHHGYVLGHSDGPGSFDMRDNAEHALKARVPLPRGDAMDDSPAPRPRGSVPSDAGLVLYEVHVKGFSKTHPGIPPELQGTYAGLAHPAAIAHFKSLGVTTLSLLPVQYHVDEPGLEERGVVNYWGYNTLGFFCPDPRFAAGSDDPAAVNAEFRAMVRTLHEHGLEVVLDVVYNHTPEGNEYGPTLCFRGLDNASWYRLDPDDPARSENLTGCGNTLNAAHPRVRGFVLDSLRYWVNEMGVDGFRFDLAPVLGRTREGFDPHAEFFGEILRDPVLSRVHLIAEPWDAGPSGYQLGNFPGRFLEWNDKFRDAVRGYWLPRDARNPGVSRAELARRFAASPDRFRHDGRSPAASVNFVSVHDGFTLADVVSYSRKHNDANGEDNRDGRDEELCANFGAEGPTADAHIRMQRERVRRAMMATLLLAQGTPMLCAGDEIGNSQHGNNNAYCQDNPTGWLDWPAADREFNRFVASLLELRRAESLLRQDAWLTDEPATDGPLLAWYSPRGQEMRGDDWQNADESIACLISSPPLASADGKGSARRRVLILFNPGAVRQPFTPPVSGLRVELDSSGDLHIREQPAPGDAREQPLAVPAQAVVVLRGVTPDFQ